VQGSHASFGHVPGAATEQKRALAIGAAFQNRHDKNEAFQRRELSHTADFIVSDCFASARCPEVPFFVIGR
jgi:hypothetical protein